MRRLYCDSGVLACAATLASRFAVVPFERRSSVVANSYSFDDTPPLNVKFVADVPREIHFEIVEGVLGGLRPQADLRQRVIRRIR